MKLSLADCEREFATHDAMFKACREQVMALREQVDRPAGHPLASADIMALVEQIQVPASAVWPMFTAAIKAASADRKVALGAILLISRQLLADNGEPLDAEVSLLVTICCFRNRC